MSYYEYQGEDQHPAHASQTTAPREHPARSAKQAHQNQTTQAERAVMHPVFSAGPDDYGDPDWRCYYATIA